MHDDAKYFLDGSIWMGFLLQSFWMMTETQSMEIENNKLEFHDQSTF